MNYQIPVFHINVNDKERFLAYLHPITSEAYAPELNEAFDDIDKSLTEEFKDSDIHYERQKLRLFYIDQSRTNYILWYPENGNLQENIPFIYGFNVPKIDPITIIEFDKITANFPHIFWTEEQLTKNSQSH